jgi:hypothetical protein
LIATGAPKQTTARNRQARHDEVLGRWPVLNEAWARRIEDGRTTGREPPRRPMEGITPLEAINSRMGLPAGHGADAVARAIGDA